ncbi:MAG: hypothetical protein E6Q97_09290 [Desulfurellales bacterium]|nr:MAG: hypothetical protein E6Q97_09290 [Desulfurellales bacterium]
MKYQTSDPIPFGEFKPDLGAFNNSGGALVINNAVPYGENYMPFNDLDSISAALGEKCLGGISYRDAEGNVMIFAGTATKLWKLDGAGFVDVTRAAGGNYSTATDGFWDFVTYGTLVIASNYNDDIQCFDIASSTEFELMSATAPRCRRMAIVQNFLVCYDTVDIDGAVGYRVRWSPLADPRGVWGSILATQTDFQDIYGGDYSNAYIAPINEYGVIVQGRALWRMDYVGGDKIFEFNPVDKGRGSLLPRTCITNGRSVFFLGEDGFYEYDGASLISIGNEKIDKTFFAMMDQTYDYHMSTTVDPLRKLVIWAFPDTNAENGECNRLACFSWANRRWTTIDQAVDCLFSFISVGYNMDQIDSLYPNLDLMPISLDSRILTGGKTSLGAFGADHSLGLFTGAAKQATIQTSEVRLNANGRAVLGGIIPNVDGTDIVVTGRLGTRRKIGDPINWSGVVEVNPYTGMLDFTKESNLFRVELTISGGWTYANSLSISSKPAGDA